MKRKRFTEKWIISILNERGAGALATDLTHMRVVVEQSTPSLEVEVRRQPQAAQTSSKESLRLIRWRTWGLDKQMLYGVIEMPETR